MKKVIETMVQKISHEITKDIRDICKTEGYKVFDMLLCAYNDYQESERDSAEYIFNIEDTNDLKHCVDGGMTAKEISELYEGSQVNHLRYFFYNGGISTPIANWQLLQQHLISSLSDLIPKVLAYPFAYHSYRQLYRKYVTDNIIGYEENDESLDALAALKAKLEQD